MFQDSLRDKVQEQLVGVPVLELGGTINLKLMLDLIMKVNDISLKSITQHL